MKKSRLLKISLAAVAILSLILLFSISAIAAPSVKITYLYGNYAHTDIVDASDSFMPFAPTLEGDEYYGWIDSKGTLYPKNKVVSFDKDTTLYLVAGCQVSTGEELFSAIENGKTYVKLNNNIGVDSALVLNPGVFVLDTNGYTLSITTEGDGICGTDTGIVFMGDGKVSHIDEALVPGLVMSGLVSFSPTAGVNYLFVSVEKNVTVETNVDFVSVESNISTRDGIFTASVYGELECNRFMYTRGISNGSFTVYDGAHITTSCEYFFEDTSKSTAERYVNLSILGGQFDLHKLNGYAENHEKYQAAISGGTFSQDITGCFPAANYKFTYSAGVGYRFHSCAHEGAIISGIPSSCTEAATLTYRCSYCNATYTKAFPTGIGHTIVTSIEQPMINTEELTQKGIYKHYCQKCDEVTTYEDFYPQPDEAYISVKVINLQGKERIIRVVGRELFDFKFEGEKATAINFNTLTFESKYNITQQNIISVEIPLGTTDIYGEWPSNSDLGIGCFCKNQHLQEVILPESIVNIQKCAFRNMSKLKTVTGLEHVTGTIGEYAFYQDHANVLIDQLELNATSIGQYAFRNFRMNSVYFGSSVKSISAGAFYLDAGITGTKEVIIEGYTGATPTTVQSAMSAVSKSYNTTQQQFTTQRIVYSDHQCDATVYKADCYQAGYTHYKCKNCSYERIDDRVPQLSHEFSNVHVEPTCKTQGYTVDMCVNCGEEVPGTKVVSEGRNPNAHSYDDNIKAPLYANFETNQYFEGGSICLDSYCMVRKCTTCNALNYEDAYNAQIISPTGMHDIDLSTQVIIKEPNCGEYGVARFTCKVCNGKVEGDIPKTNENHKWDAGTVIKVPTCTESGIKEFKCTVCTSKEGTKQVNLNKDTQNHDWDKGVVLREPTEMVAGVKEITCNRCGDSFTEGINKLEAKKQIPLWVIILGSAGGILLVGGVVLTLYFTFFKKKRASDSYKYKFNTLGK